MPDQDDPAARTLWAAFIDLIQQSALHAEAVAAAVGLDTTALRCIGFIASEPDMTPGRLADLTGLTTGAVTGVLDRLERGGFVRRVPDPTDRRRTLIRVADEHGSMGDGYDQLVAAIEDIASRLEPLDRARLTRTLDAMRAAVATDTARLRAATRGGMVGEMFRGPLGDARTGRLVFASGAPRVALRAAPLGPASEVRAVAELARSELRLGSDVQPGELCRATFAGPMPEMRAERDGTVTCRYRTRLDWRAREAAVELSPELPWSISVSGGLSSLTGDLSALRVDTLDVSGGVDELEVRLPRPDGTSRIRVSGSAARLTLTHPRGSAVRVAISGGVRDVQFGSQRSRDAHGGLRLETPGASRAPDRFEVEISGGVGNLRIEEA
jgi:DNA-binding MarR family transcriptional regulator